MASRAKTKSVELDVQSWTSGPFTVVVVSGERHVGVGVAKCHPHDRPDPQIGYDVASARALRELAGVTEENAGV